MFLLLTTTNSASTNSTPSLDWGLVVDIILAAAAICACIIAFFARSDTKRQANESKRLSDVTEKTLELQKSQFELYKKELEDQNTRFLVGQERERYSKLLLHYQKLCERVISRWSEARTVNDLGSPPYERAEVPIYLITATFLEFGTHSESESREYKRWLEWAFEHIKNDPIASSFEKLKELDKSHNEALSAFVKKIKTELDDTLKDVTDYSPARSFMNLDFSKKLNRTISMMTIGS